MRHTGFESRNYGTSLIICIDVCWHGKHNEFADKLLDLIEFIKVASYKINKLRSFAYLYNCANT